MYNLKSGFLKKKTALDIGCANGANSFYLASRGIRVDAVDKKLPAWLKTGDGDRLLALEEKGFEEIRELFAKNKFTAKNPNFIESDIMDFDLGKEKYDIIVANYVLHLLNDKNEKVWDPATGVRKQPLRLNSKLDLTAGRLRRALKPGGMIFIEDFSMDSKHMLDYYFERGELALMMKSMGLNVVINRDESILCKDEKTLLPYRYNVATVVARNTNVRK